MPPQTYKNLEIIYKCWKKCLIWILRFCILYLVLRIKYLESNILLNPKFYYDVCDCTFWVHFGSNVVLVYFCIYWKRAFQLIFQLLCWSLSDQASCCQMRRSRRWTLLDNSCGSCPRIKEVFLGVWIWTTTYSNNLQQQQSSNSMQTAEAPAM